jgi:hypothetical protein
MATLVPLQTLTVTNATTTSVTFSNIDQSYTDLQIVMHGAVATANWTPALRFNGDTGTNYSWTNLATSSTSTPIGERGSNFSYLAIGYTDASWGTTFGANHAVVNIMSYSSSALYKTVLARSNTNDSYSTNLPGANLCAGLWRGTGGSSTAPITSVTVTTTSGSINFGVGTTFSLYGIGSVNAKNTAASGGTFVSYDASYVYHVFNGTGTLTTNRAITADVLVIGGGGGGASAAGGGGGAGGLCWQSGRSLSAFTTYTVTVGAGGPGGYSDGSSGINGSNSVFDTITANGGGYGSHNGTGSSGGSGGGAGYNTGNVGGAANQGTSGGATGYGNAGGNSARTGTGSPYSSSGGGGAGGAGGSATESAGGVGGVGLTYTTIAALDVIGAATGTGQLSSGHYYYAGGGGGSRDTTTAAGGLGGGGRGGTVLTGGVSSAPYAGTMNTGGGGGGGVDGGLYSTNGGNTGNRGMMGGSGLVIVRYAR